jgi:hypothetical protein
MAIMRIAKLVGVFVFVAATFGVFASVAGADQGGRVVNDQCLTSGCIVRGIRVQIEKPTAWGTPPSGTAEAIWVGGGKGDTNHSTSISLVQAGLLKAPDNAPTGCSSGTAGAVWTFAEWINASGTIHCVLGGTQVQDGEGHLFKVMRCGSSNSCAFLDGTPIGPTTGYDIGIIQYTWDELIGEYTPCFICEPSGDNIYSNLGGVGQLHQFVVTDCGTSCSSPTWHTVTTAETARFDNSCGSGQLNQQIWTGNWTVDAIDPSAPWTLRSNTPFSQNKC